MLNWGEEDSWEHKCSTSSQRQRSQLILQTEMWPCIRYNPKDFFKKPLCFKCWWLQVLLECCWCKLPFLWSAWPAGKRDFMIFSQIFASQQPETSISIRCRKKWTCCFRKCDRLWSVTYRNISEEKKRSLFALIFFSQGLCFEAQVNRFLHPQDPLGGFCMDLMWKSTSIKRSVFMSIWWWSELISVFLYISYLKALSSWRPLFSKAV